MILITGLQMLPVEVLYTNHRGETAIRKFRPYNLYWGSNEFHPEPQWLMEGWDEEKGATRTYALKDMSPAPKFVRVWFKNGEYTDVFRGQEKAYETQQDFDRSEFLNDERSGV